MKKWITKKEITRILNAYSVRRDEFEPLGKSGYFYQSRILRGYTITLSEERQEGKDLCVKTGRILVTHARTNGRKTFLDVWERDENNVLQFCFRNPWDRAVTDVEIIRDLEEQNRQLRQTGLQLQEQLKKKQPKESSSQELNIENSHSKELNALLERIGCLEKELQELKNKAHNARGAGRKPSKERQGAVEQLKSMLEEGKSDMEIQEALNISKSTFYRYKRSVKN